MPIIKSAKKQMRQNVTHRLRNYRMRDRLKLSIKAVALMVKDGKQKEANEALKTAYKMIDFSAKKRLIHKNNAAHKKSGLAKLVANMSLTKPSGSDEVKPAKKTTVQKVTAKQSKEKKVAPKAVTE